MQAEKEKEKARFAERNAAEEAKRVEALKVVEVKKKQDKEDAAVVIQQRMAKVNEKKKVIEEAKAEAEARRAVKRDQMLAEAEVKKREQEEAVKAEKIAMGAENEAIRKEKAKKVQAEKDAEKARFAERNAAEDAKRSSMLEKAEAADGRGEEHQVDGRVGIELLDQPMARRGLHTAVEAQMRDGGHVAGEKLGLDEIEHRRALREDECAVRRCDGRVRCSLSRRRARRLCRIAGANAALEEDLLQGLQLG